MSIKTDEDWTFEQERHRRRMALMTAMGETNRLERRMFIWLGVTFALAALAILLGAL